MKNPWMRMACGALALGACVLAFTCAFQCIGHRYLDYDEISHAHMAWLVARGAVPYEDFAMNHFPFFWLALAPLARWLPESPAIFTAYRIGALALNLVFVFLLMAHAWQGRPREERPWIALAMLIPVFQPDVMNALIEFRPDALANPLLFGALLWLRRHSRHAWLAGLAIAAALLINTKYLPLPLAIGLASLCRRHLREIPFRKLGGVALGLSFGLALAVGLMRWRQISPSLAFDMVIRYNWLAARLYVPDVNLLRTTLEHPMLLNYIGIGVVAAVVAARRGRLRWNRYAAGVLLFTVLQLALNGKGWKHYYAAWLLLAAFFPAASLAVFAPRANWLRLALCAALAGAALNLHLLRSDTVTLNLAGGPVEVDRAMQTRAMDALLAQTAPDARVASDLFWHPVFRRDAFYKAMYDDIGGQDRTDETFAHMAGFAYANRFNQAYYEDELRRHPPDGILMGRIATTGIFSIYPPLQSKAVENHLRRHETEYEFLPIDGTPLLAVVRRHPAAAEPIQGSK